MAPGHNYACLTFCRIFTQHYLRGSGREPPREGTLYVKVMAMFFSIGPLYKGMSHFDPCLLNKMYIFDPLFSNHMQFPIN